MLVSDAVQTVRSMVLGSALDDVSVLDAAYDPVLDSSITLRYAKRAITPGSILSVGLNTFLVLEITTDGTDIVVHPSADGGPNVAAAAGTLVHVRPAFTTYSIFRELVGEIVSLSSPASGVFATALFQSEGNSFVDGVYSIDPDDLAAGRSIIGLVRAEYRIGDTEAWHTFQDCEWQPSGHVVRVFADPPRATEYLFTFSTTFGTPTALTDDLDTFGVSDGIADVAVLGAAAQMALTWEGRRMNPTTQGDTRRSAEIAATGSSSLARQFRARQKERLNEEIARLIKQYGYRQNIASGGSTWFNTVNR